MRLFLAIGLSTEVRDALFEEIRRLKPCCEQGRFTERENLHLTLVFLGEVPSGRVGAAADALESARIPMFALCIGGIGYFRRPGGDVCWAGVENSRALSGAYGELCARLTVSGFAVEKRPYRPHVTLGRGIVLRGDCRAPDVPPMRMRVDAVGLMRSDRIAGRMKYTAVHTKRLKGDVVP